MSRGAYVGIKPAPLTPRQKEVLALYAQGLRHKSIAARLGIAPGTVNSTLDRIQINLCLSDRWQLRDYLKGGQAV